MIRWSTKTTRCPGRRFPLSPRALGWLCLLAGTTAALAAGDPAAERPAFQRAVLIRLEGVITPLMENFLERKLASSAVEQAELVIVEIDSPGGFVDSSFNIAHRLRDLDGARTVAFVPREALSGGAIMALGCEQIVIAPNAVLGDAGPIFQGEDALFRHAPEKIRSDIALKIRDLAQTHGRPPALAEAMVNMDVVVYRVRNQQTGEEGFMSDQEIRSSADPEAWQKLQPVLESREDHFLEVTGQRAVELGLADGLARDREQLAGFLSLDRPPRVLQHSATDTAVFVLNLPIVTGLLLVIGLLALYVEFSVPGIGAGGLIAALCFVLFFWSRFLGGTAGALEVILFLMGVVFIAMEFFVIPGFGVAGITGLALLVASIVMASQHFFVPSTGRQLATFSTSVLVVSLSAVGFLIAVALLSRHLGTLPIFNRLALAPPVEARTADAPTKTENGKPQAPTAPNNPWGIDVGDWGTAISPLRPSGKVRFGDHHLDVLTDGCYVEAGRPVRIVKISGNHVVVTAVEEA